MTVIDSGRPAPAQWDPEGTAGGSSLRVCTLERFHGVTAARRLNQHLLLYVLEGDGEFMVDFVEHRLCPGMLVFARPGQLQQLRADRGLDAIAISFSSDFPARFPIPETSIIDEVYGTLTWRLSGRERESLELAFREFAREFAVTDDDPTHVELQRLLLAALLLRVIRLSTAGRRETPLFNQDYLTFRRELTRAFATTHSAADYASRLGMTTRTLNRICLQASGRTAKQLIDARLALEAQRLLAYTDLSVGSIADRLGFSEPTNFVKFFQRVTHTTPGEFRRAHTRS